MGKPAAEREEPLRDVQWLAAYVGVPVATIYGWRLRGEGPPAYRVGRHLRFRVREVEKWLETRRG